MEKKEQNYKENNGKNNKFMFVTFFFIILILVVPVQASKGKILYISDCPTLYETKQGNLIVIVQNIGSPDYIGVNAKSDNYLINGNDRVYFNSSETKTFNFTLTALGSSHDVNVPIEILADGTDFNNGDDTKSVNCTIKNLIPVESKPSNGFNIVISIIGILTLYLIYKIK
jgi:hypothetical protein